MVVFLLIRLTVLPSIPNSLYYWNPTCLKKRTSSIIAGKSMFLRSNRHRSPSSRLPLYSCEDLFGWNPTTEGVPKDMSEMCSKCKKFSTRGSRQCKYIVYVYHEELVIVIILCLFWPLIVLSRMHWSTRITSIRSAFKRLFHISTTSSGCLRWDPIVLPQYFKLICSMTNPIS